MNPLAWLWLINVLLVVDWAKNRREPFWLFVLILLGPIGAMAYIIYFYEDITFPFPLAQTYRRLTGTPVTRICRRCGKRVSQLVPVEQGRQTHHMCRSCGAEVRALGEP